MTKVQASKGCTDDWYLLPQYLTDAFTIFKANLVPDHSTENAVRNKKLKLNDGVLYSFRIIPNHQLLAQQAWLIREVEMYLAAVSMMQEGVERDSRMLQIHSFIAEVKQIH